MKTTNNKGLLTIIAVVLIGILGLVIVETNKETSGDKLRDSVSEVIDSTGNGFHEFSEEVKDEIDDSTGEK